MKGLVKYARGAGHMETREVAEPVVGEGTVVIDVEAATGRGTRVAVQVPFLDEQVVQS